MTALRHQRRFWRPGAGIGIVQNRQWHESAAAAAASHDAKPTWKGVTPQPAQNSTAQSGQR
eukprot:COSAG01_NODE_65736_length_272_cov_0.890173_2_plen_60_part_01